MSRFVRALLCALTSVAFASGVLPGEAAAALWQQQAGGTVTGRVVNATTLQPLDGAQVFIPDQNIGTLTQRNGNYLILNVPAGTVVVEVRIIGFRTQRSEVTVQAGQTVQMNFEMSFTAISLDELVVTGTGVAEQRRQLGTSVSALDAGLIERTGAQTVTSALAGRVPGFLPTVPGNSGESPPIRFRGNVSLTQRNQPVLIVDGVRMDGGFSQVGAGSRGHYSNRLDDINPSDIERIEIIKGAAAATLFGTEASSGVIQVFTKRGREGAPRYSFEISQQGIQIPPGRLHPMFAYDPSQHEILTTRPDTVFIQNGHRQNYSLSVAGGTATTSYYVSGRFTDERGPMLHHGAANKSLRVSIETNHSEKLRTDVGLSIIRNTVESDGEVGWFYGYTLSNPLGITADRPFGEQFGAMGDILNSTGLSTVDNIAVRGRTVYQWMPNLTSEVVFGFNQVHDRFGFAIEQGLGKVRNRTGRRDLRNVARSKLTADLNTSWTTDLTDQLGLQVWAGGQAFIEKEESQTSAVRDFPSPGLRTLDGGATILDLSERFVEVVNAGVFTQAQFGYADRLFLTGGLRADGNSAFGEDFGTELYPKVSLSYVLSEESFWPQGALGLSLLRLRGAYGTSGLQPGAFDAVRTWQPQTRLGGLPVVAPGNVGNSDLKPERSVERELGADLGFFDDRLGIDFTYFWQHTKDAILERELSATLGFLEPQLINIGATESSGLELVLNAALVQERTFGWSLSGTLAALNQEVTALGLGDVTSFRMSGVGSRSQEHIAVGEAPGVFLAPGLDESDPYTLSVPIEQFNRLSQLVPNILQTAAGRDSIVNYGHPLPTYTASLSTDFRLPGGFNLRALFTGIQGGTNMSEIGLLMYQSGTREDVSQLGFELGNPSTTTERRREIAAIHASKHPNIRGNWVFKNDYIRFQELSLGYEVPESFATNQLHFSNLTLSLTAHNLKLWTRFDEFAFHDPATPRPNRVPASIVSLNNNWSSVPAARRLSLTFRGNF
jgi:outer membrane receptor protein involved in Fe transport